MQLLHNQAQLITLSKHSDLLETPATTYLNRFKVMELTEK